MSPAFPRFQRSILITLALAAAAAPAVAQDTGANCTVTFDATWSEATHPTDWPGNSAHFSPLIGATHDDQVIFWQPGEFASDGVRIVAEFGATGTFTGEINTEIGLGTADAVINGPAVGISPDTVSTSFDIELSHPLLTLITMIAPSPDWFVGVHGEPLFENGSWTTEKVFDLPPYDAGTDSGTTFFSPDSVTIPTERITLLTDPPLAGAPSMGTYTVRCTSPLVFTDGFETGDLSAWSTAVGSL
ncbi:MAG: spondin domain-containing protein [Acidobacteriota bacterium]